MLLTHVHALMLSINDICQETDTCKKENKIFNISFNPKVIRAYISRNIHTNSNTKQVGKDNYGWNTA